MKTSLFGSLLGVAREGSVPVLLVVTMLSGSVASAAPKKQLREYLGAPRCEGSAPCKEAPLALGVGILLGGAVIAGSLLAGAGVILAVAGVATGLAVIGGFAATAALLASLTAGGSPDQPATGKVPTLPTGSTPTTGRPSAGGGTNIGRNAPTRTPAAIVVRTSRSASAAGVHR